MDIDVREYRESDLADIIEIWNEVVEDGAAFPQEERLGREDGAAFFAAQTFCGVAEERESETLLGLYILHPNNVGRCGHIANASFAVRRSARGNHIGERLVRHCLAQTKISGFRILQFNAVVGTNKPARQLYERLGFVHAGTIPGGFRLKSGEYEDICVYYHTL